MRWWELDPIVRWAPPLDCRFKVKTVLLNSIKSTQLNTMDFN